MSDELEQLDEGPFADVPNPRQRAFFAAYCAGLKGKIKPALKAVNLSTSQHWMWLAHDPEYPARWAKVEKIAACRMEQEADRRAIEGVRRPVLYKGQQVNVIDPRTGQEVPLYETTYSDVLLMFRLKAIDPEKYRERTEQQVVVKDDDVRDKIMEKAKADPAFLDRLRSMIDVDSTK
jgi:hypothetical protein